MNNLLNTTQVRANEGTSMYNSCDDQFMKDFIKKLTTEIRNILSSYEFIHHINDAIWISHIIEDIRKVLLRLDSVSYVIYRSGPIKELLDEEKNKTFGPFLHISLKLPKFGPYPLRMMDCIETLDEVLNNYQDQAKAYRLDYTTEYSLQNLLDAQRKYVSDFDKANHPLRQTPPPSEGLKEISLFDEHSFDTLKNDTITMQILKKGGLPPTVYRIPEVSLADVLKKEKIEEDIDFLLSGANLYHDAYFDSTWTKKHTKRISAEIFV